MELPYEFDLNFGIKHKFQLEELAKNIASDVELIKSLVAHFNLEVELPAIFR